MFGFGCVCADLFLPIRLSLKGVNPRETASLDWLVIFFTNQVVAKARNHLFCKLRAYHQSRERSVYELIDCCFDRSQQEESWVKTGFPSRKPLTTSLSCLHLEILHS